MKTIIKTLLAGAVFAALLPGAAALADEYPSDTIRMIVPYSAGGGTDTIARAFAAELEKIAGQTVIVENVPGASGVVGYNKLIASKPDGYTIMLTADGDYTVQIAIQKNPKIDLDDTTCAGVVYDTPVWLLSHADNNYPDLGAFFEDAKKRPGELIVGITARQGLTDFAAQAVRKAGGVDFRIVPFGNGADLAKAIQANQIQAGLIVAPVLLGEVQAGNLTVLAAGDSLAGIKEESLRGTRTMMDWGTSRGFGVMRGLYLPAGTPEDIRARIEQMADKAAHSEGFAKFGATFGFAPAWKDGKTFCSELRAQVEDYRKAVAEAGD